MLKNNSKKEIKVCKVKKKVLTMLMFNIRLVLSWFILWQDVYIALNESYNSKTYKKKQSF
jgi:hypothetical protein